MLIFFYAHAHSMDFMMFCEIQKNSAILVVLAFSEIRYFSSYFHDFQNFCQTNVYTDET